MNTSGKIALFAIAAVALIALGTGYWWFALHFFESTDNAFVRGDVTAISPGASGEIISVHVRENQTVKAGDLLAVIDPKQYEARLHQAQAQLAVAAAAERSSQQQIELQDAVVREAEAGLLAAQAEFERADQELKRFNHLADKGYVARQGIDNVRAAQRAAAAAVTKARAGIDANRQRKFAYIADRERLQAERDAAQAAVKLAELDLSYTEMRAPVDGSIADINAKPGLRVRTGTRIMTIVPLASLWIEANFKETQIARMQPGQRATSRIDAFPDQTVQGQIESLSPASGAEFALLPPENATGNFTKIVQRFPVRIALSVPENLRGRLRPGMSTRVDVDVRPEPAADSAAAANNGAGAALSLAQP